MAAAVTTGAKTTFTPEETKQFERQIVNIAGEMVAFTPTGFPKGEPSIVQFDDYYKPSSMSLSDAMILKNAFRQLFGDASLPVYDTKLGKELPHTLSLPILPPCDEIQKALVMRSLQYRFDLLRQELNVRGIRSFQDLRKRMEELKRSDAIGDFEGKDSIDVRRNLQHFQTLKQLMEKYEKAQQCFNLEDKAFGALELDLTDERARELLKQFIFFTLQAHHPLQDYKKTNPTAPSFVKRLEVNPLGDTFPKFMTTYKGNKLPIPEPIARVLDSIGAEPGLLDIELKRRLEEALAKEKEKILRYLYGFFPPESSFWRTIGSDKDVYRIVEKLVELLKDAEGQVDRLTTENEELKEKIKACESAKGPLEEQLRRMTAQVSTLATQLEAAGGKDEEIARLKDALAKATSDNLAKQEASNERIRVLQGQLDENTRLLNTLKQQVTALTEERAKLKAEVDTLKAAEAAIKADLAKVRKDYEAQLEAERGKTAAETTAKKSAIQARDTAAQELAAAKAEIVGKDETLKANTAQIAALQKAVNDCNSDTAKLRESLTAKTQEAEQLLRDKTDLASQVEEKDSRIAELTADLEEEEGDNAELRRELEELKETLTGLKAQLADKEAAFNRCEAEKAALAGPADQLAAKAAGLEGELAAAKSRADTIEAERARLEGEVGRLTEELKKRDGVVTELQGELRGKTDALEEMEGRADAAEEELISTKDALGKTTTELDEQRGLVARQRGELLAQEDQHGRQIGELTDTFKGQLADEVGKTTDETRRAELAEAAVSEQSKRAELAEAAVSEQSNRAELAEAALSEESRAYELLKSAIVALVAMETDTSEDEISGAIDPVADDDAKGNLKALYLKLLTAMRSVGGPRAAEKAVEHMASQCQNALLLAYLWQTNFPKRDAESRTLYAMINNFFTSGPYPNKPGQSLPGLYNGPRVDGRIAKTYVALLKKLLALYEFGSPLAEGSPLTLRLSDEEITQVKNLLKVMEPIESAYKTAGATSFLVTKARENMVKLQPSVEPYLPSDSLALNESESSIERAIGASTASRLSYPVLFYCFMIVLRDSLNQVSTSLSREGQCPLPQILTLQAPRRGSL